MAQKEIVVHIENVTKEYRLGQITNRTLQADLQSKWAKLRGQEDPNCALDAKHTENHRFLALDHVNLDVHQGDTLGIVGANGAGKSTLLKLLARITAPTSGTIAYNGRISSLLEIGTGFNGEMTGRENVYLNGAILGMSRAEVTAKMDRIIAFSECEEFIDTPVKRYSSGMYVKLAFAVAAHLDSEILIMDEVLAVGDMKFQKKCIDKMRQLAQEENRTVLYVSHNMATIRQLCNRCIFLVAGKIAFDGDTSSAINQYLDIVTTSQTEYALAELPRTLPTRYVKLNALSFWDHDSNYFAANETMKMRLEWEALEAIDRFCFRLEVHAIDTTIVGMTAVPLGPVQQGEHRESIVSFDCAALAPGKYYTLVSFWSNGTVFGSAPYDTPIVEIGFEIGLDNGAEPTWDTSVGGYVHLPAMKQMAR